MWKMSVGQEKGLTKYKKIIRLDLEISQVLHEVLLSQLYVLLLSPISV